MSNECLYVLGVMSGSSLDGIDLGLFSLNSNDYPEISWSCLKSHTEAYPVQLRKDLSRLETLSATEYFIVENRYTDFIIKIVRSFLGKEFTCDLLGIHGHTFVHQPKDGYSVQLGNMGKICEKLNTPCIGDFRNQDIAVGGEGAPMAPLVDHLLFSTYDSWINLGGIVNITTKKTAYDIGPFNQVINYIAQSISLPYDRDGNLGRSGAYIRALYLSYNLFPYYTISPPKSLSNVTIRDYFFPLIDNSQHTPQDMIHTFYRHIGEKISLGLRGKKNCLITGGGAHNKYFMEILRKLNPDTIIETPSTNIIDFKEALLIALAAHLRYFGRPNYISEITAAERPVSAGALYIQLQNG